MASESVQKILEAEAIANKQTKEAWHKADEIIQEAEKNAVLAIQKKLAEAKIETEKIRNLNEIKLNEYSQKVEQECIQKITNIKSIANANFDKVVNLIICNFFE